MELFNYSKIYDKTFNVNLSLPVLTYYTKGETITYGQLAYNIGLAHTFYRAIGIKPGDKIALCGKDCSDWIQI